MAMALLIVDMQAGLFANGPGPHDLDSVFERINQLARRARAAGAPVFLIQHEAASTELAHGSPGWQLDARLATQASDVRVRKRSSAPYASSPLHAMLAERDVGAVAVAGYASEFCIDSTVRWSASLGYQVTLVSDAHTTHDKPHLDAASIIAHHNATLPAIHSLGAPIVAAPAATLWPGEPAPVGGPVATAHATHGDAATLLDDLVTAFEWVSADLGGDNTAYVCRRTGQVHWHGGDGGLDEELPDDLDDDMNHTPAPVRQAVPADIPGIQRVRAAVKENRLVSGVIDDDEVRHAIQVSGRGWVVERGSRIVGFAIGNADTGNIWALFIDPAHAGQGHGRRLHDTMLEWLWSRGLRRLWLSTDPGTRAQRFYASAGWSARGLLPDGEMLFERFAPHPPTLPHPRTE